MATQLGFLQNAMGAALSPQDAWLVLRGLKTLALPLGNRDSPSAWGRQWLSTAASRPRIGSVPSAQQP